MFTNLKILLPLLLLKKKIQIETRACCSWYALYFVLINVIGINTNGDIKSHRVVLVMSCSISTLGSWHPHTY